MFIINRFLQFYFIVQAMTDFDLKLKGLSIVISKIKLHKKIRCPYG